MGDRVAYLHAARFALERLHTGSDKPLVSAIYETEPVDCAPGTALYVNAVMEIEYAGEPLELLHVLQKIERSQGRPADHAFHSPRTLDLDLLYAGDIVLNTAELVLPHPRIAERRFVLQPLADIRPELILPGMHQTVAELLACLPLHPVVKPFSSWISFLR